MTSGDAAEVIKALYMPQGQTVPAAAVSGLKSLAPIQADAASFTIPDSAQPDVATMDVTTGAGARWRWTLLWQSGTWMIAQSVKL